MLIKILYLTYLRSYLMYLHSVHIMYFRSLSLAWFVLVLRILDKHSDIVIKFFKVTKCYNSNIVD